MESTDLLEPICVKLLSGFFILSMFSTLQIVRLSAKINRDKFGSYIIQKQIGEGDFDPAIFPIPPELEQGIIDAYQNHYTNYPAAEGNLDLRETLSAFIQERQKLNYSINEIVVAAGGRPLIYTIFRTVCDKGDKVIYAVPSWNNNHYTHFVEGEHIVIETTEQTHFMPTANSIRPHIKKASLLSLCSPQNPTGTTFRKEELEATDQQRLAKLEAQANLSKEEIRQQNIKEAVAQREQDEKEREEYTSKNIIPGRKNSLKAIQLPPGCREQVKELLSQQRQQNDVNQSQSILNGQAN